MLLAVCQEMGIQNELVPRIASMFGGGMARTGEVCGAVVGALMCIGIAHGREDSTQSDEEGYVLSQRLLRRFRQEMGSILCRELTGMDLTTPEQLEAYRNSEVRLKVCLPAVGLAYRLALELAQVSGGKA